MRAVFLHPTGLCVMAATVTVALLWSQVPGLTRLSIPSSWLLFWAFTAYVAVSVVLMWPIHEQTESAGYDVEGLEPTWSDATVEHQLRVESLRQPTTLVPLAGGALLIAHAVLLAPDARLWEVALGLGGFLFATATYVWSSVIRYSERHDARVTAAMLQIDQERSRRDAAESARLRQRLRDGFSLVKSEAGAGSFERLEEANLQLQIVLRDRRTPDSLALSLVPGLAEETYRRGLSVLDDALELMRASYGFDSAQLRDEIKQLLAQSTEADGSAWRLLQEQRVGLYRQRLEGHERLRLDIDRLLYQAERCETSLYESRLHLAAIRAGTSEQSLASVIDALRTTVEQARATQDELRRMAQ